MSGFCLPETITSIILQVKKINDTEYQHDDVSNTWHATKKTLYYYNENERDSLEMNYYYDSGRDIWQYLSKTDYIYSDSSRTTNRYTYDIINNIWTPDRVVEEVYDNNGNVLRNTITSWNSSSSLWQKNNMDIYAYDNMNRLILHQFHWWDSNTNKWVNKSKETKTYDDQGRLYQYQSLSWQNESWELIGRVDSVYDAEGRLFSKATYNFYMIPYKGIKYEYFYNNDGIKVSYKEYNGTFDEWNFSSIGYYYWTHTITNDIANNITPNYIYPNPASRFITILSAGKAGKSSVSIYNMSGILIMEEKFNDSLTLDISSLKNGIYNCLIRTSDNKVFSEKLIKQ